MKRTVYFRLKNAMLLGALISNTIGVSVVILFSRIELPSTAFQSFDLLQRIHFGFMPFAFLFPIAATLVYERPIRRYLDSAYSNGELHSPPPLQVKQRLLNEPFFQIGLSCAIWFLAALTYSTRFWLSGTGLETALIPFFLSLQTGLITICIEFFVLEFLLQRRLAPHFFPDGNLTGVPGTLRISIRLRLVAMVFACNLVPFFSILLSLQPGQTDADPAVVLQNLQFSILVSSLIFMAVGIWLVFLVSSNLTRPLQEIIRVLHQVRHGRFDAQVQVTSNDEIGYTGNVINDMNTGLRERDFIKETFGKYVSSEIRDEILAGRVALEGERKEVTVLFADLRNFTPLVEQTPPQQVVSMLNRYFERMERAIHRHQGLVLQYIGDEIEAVFGAPVPQEKHPLLALETAIEMRRQLEELNAGLLQEGHAPLKHGIGIHTGEVLAANIGSPNRLSYALVGDTVNLASRLQGLTKHFQTDCIISQTTYARVHSAFSFQELSPTEIKGKTGLIQLYALT